MGRFSVLFFPQPLWRERTFLSTTTKRATWAEVTPCLPQQMNSIVVYWARGQEEGKRRVPFHLTVSQGPMNWSQWWQTNKVAGRPTRGDTRLLWREFAHAVLTCGTRRATSAKLAGGLHEMSIIIIEMSTWLHCEIHFLCSCGRQYTHWNRTNSSKQFKSAPADFFSIVFRSTFLLFSFFYKMQSPFSLCAKKLETSVVIGCF